MKHGYSSTEKNDRLGIGYPCVEGTRPKQDALSVLAHLFVYVVGTDAVEADSTTESIVATAHAATRGDVIRFTSGALSGQEVKIRGVTANAIDLAENLASAPLAAVTFQILRHRYPLVDSTGSLTLTSSLPAGASTEAKQDTGNASLASMDTKLSTITGHVDGIETLIGTTNSTLATLDGRVDGLEGLVGTTNTTLTTIDGRVDGLETLVGTTNTTLSTISGKLPATLGAKTSAASLAVVLASDQAALPVTGTFWQATQPVSAASLPLPSGASTAANQSTIIGHVDGIETLIGTTNTTLSTISGKLPAALGQGTMAASLTVAIASNQSAIPASQSGTWNVTNISGTVSLPTGAATAANQTTMIGHLDGVETTLTAIDGRVDTLESLIGTTNTTLTTIDGRVDGVETLLTSISGHLNRDVVDLIDTTPVLDTASTTINGSAGAFVAIVASLAAAVREIRVNDTTGEFIGVYTGAAAAEVLQCVVGPGMDGIIPVQMSAAERVTLRNMATTSITTGKICIQFLG